MPPVTAAVKLTGVPAQTAPVGAPVMDAEGLELTLSVVVAGAEAQPRLSVIVTVKVNTPTAAVAGAIDAVVAPVFQLKL